MLATLRTGRQQLGVDALAAGGERADLALHAREQFVAGPDGVGLVVVDVEVPGQAPDDFREDGPRHEDGRLLHGVQRNQMRVMAANNGRRKHPDHAM
jgi:hypothetical protein